MRKRWRLHGLACLGFLLAASLIAGCSGDGATGPGPSPQPQPRAGALQVTIAAGSPGAVVLHVTGPSMSNPTAMGGAHLYYDLSGSTLRAAVVGTSLNGAVLRFSVPDVDDVADYAVSVQQAAGNDDEPIAVSLVSANVSAIP